MRTRTQRIDARTDVMTGVNDHDTTLCQALMELCATIDDAAERTAEAHEETRKAIDQLGDALTKGLRQAAEVR